MPETTAPVPSAPADTPITLSFLKSWLPPLVTAGGLLVAGTTAWFSMDVRVATVEAKVAKYEAAQGQSVKRDKLLAKFICRTLGNADPLCTEAMDSIGGSDR